MFANTEIYTYVLKSNCAYFDAKMKKVFKIINKVDGTIKFGKILPFLFLKEHKIFFDSGFIFFRDFDTFNNQ